MYLIFTTFRKSQDLPDMSFIAYLDQVKQTFLDMKPIVRRSNLSRMSLKNFFQRLFSLSNPTCLAIGKFKNAV